MTFKELARIGAEQLAKQKPMTSEQARSQAKRVQERIENKIKKQGYDIQGTSNTGN